MNSAIKERCYNEYLNEIQASFCEFIENSNPVENYLLENCKKIQNSFYLVYPFYFESHFNNLNEKELYELALCGNLYFSYLLLLDGFLDGHSGISIFALHKLHEVAIFKIVKLFPPESVFWKYFDMYGKCFEAGIIKEKKIFGKAESAKITDEDFESITKSKCAFAKCTTAGLISLSGIDTDGDPFVFSQDQFHSGLQILDDLDDWKEDFKNNRNSYLLGLAFSDIEFKKILDASDYKENVLGKYIYLSGLAVDLLYKALKYFQNAQKSCKKLNVPAWLLLIESYIIKCEDLIHNYLYVINQTNARNKHITVKDKELNLPVVVVSSQLYSVFKNALQYILIERDNSYLEMTHVMKLPSSEMKLTEDNGINVYGNIFQRSIILETYLDINTLDNKIIENEIIRGDLLEIVNYKARNVNGGWSYFPEYSLLPPDTDDLAQVIQLLVRSNYSIINDLIDEPLNLLMNYNNNDDGTFKTWILDPLDESEQQQKLKKAVQNYWGDYYGRDIEVTANLLYSLFLYDKNRFIEIIDRGIERIVKSREAQGHWKSVWYCGPYYGTYIVARLLAETNFRTDCLLETKKFILSSQNNDGGWGINKSDPLNTALAVLILKYIDKVYDSDSRPFFEKAISYLEREQLNIGSWKNIPFIKMKIGERELTYGSETISTAFVLKALTKIIS